MKNIYFCKLFSLDLESEKNNNNNKNLNSQIFNLINSIINAYENDKKIIIVDKFLNDFYGDNLTSNISDILNLDKLNCFLKENYNILLFDKENLEFKVNNIKFGLNNNCIDLTNEILSKFSLPNSNSLLVNTDVNLIFLKGYDPIINIQKKVYIKYSINNYTFEEIYDECDCVLKEPIIFNLNNENFNFDSVKLSNVKNKNMFDHILQNLQLSDIYDIISKNYFELNNLENKKINIVDLRLDNDIFKQFVNEDAIYEKYLEVIKRYILKHEKTIILYNDLNLDVDLEITNTNKTKTNYVNPVLKFLHDSDYNFSVSKNMTVFGSEINYNINLSIGKKCNNVYIGNFNMNKMNGSDFTYTLIQQMNHNVKHVLIDINNTKNKEEINF
jgi:hypothetical protein